MLAIEVPAYGESSVLRVVERPEPRPAAGEVAIRVSATGVNFADIMARRGAYHAGNEPPYVPGLDAAGTVTALGAGVTSLRVGQRVAFFPDAGSYAEVVVAREILTYALDDAVSDDAGASLLLLVTAYNALTLAGRFVAGETVLINAAAGGVGTTAIQIARALGAKTIVAVAGGADKVALARRCGADVTVDHRSEDVGAAVRAACGDAPIDVVLDSVAGDDVIANLALLAPFGRYVVYGMASGKAGTIATDALHPSNRAVVGYSSGGYRKLRPAGLRPAADAAFALVAAGKVAPLIGARFALRDAAQAHDLVESRASTGKVLLLTR